MILIDTNALIILVLGLMDPRQIKNHKRTSIYEEKDFYELVNAIGTFDRLMTLPNVWTETDNLLNNFKNSHKYNYYLVVKKLVSETSEKYLSTSRALLNDSFLELGITDSLILEIGEDCEFIITSDSKLSDYAIANGIKVYDVVKMRNSRF